MAASALTVEPTSRAAAVPRMVMMATARISAPKATYNPSALAQ
jgi:hypothetical protein